MDARLGWALAVVAVAVGYWQWGWPGVALSLTLVVFWMLLQFSRTMRVMGKAGEAPIGSIRNAVMLQSRLRPGLALLEVLPITGSLGVKTSDEPEIYVWTDAGGDTVTVVFRQGKVESWQLARAGGADEAGEPAPTAIAAAPDTSPPRHPA